MKQLPTIKKNFEFTKVFRKGKYSSSKSVNVNYIRNRRSYNRLGVTTVKKVDSAVKRNRLKRLLRESLRSYQADLVTGYDLIFTARLVNGQLPDFQRIHSDMGYVLRKAELIKKTEKILRSPVATSSDDVDAKILDLQHSGETGSSKGKSPC